MSQAADLLKTEKTGRKRKCLLLSGVPEVPGEKVLDTSLALLHKHLVGLDIDCNSIKYCHRLGAYSEGRNRPIVIRFCMGVVRGQVWKAKTKLKGSGLVLAEFLTKDRQTLFQTARKHFGLSNVWTSNGSVHVKTPDGTRHRVAILKELNCLVEQHPTSSPSPNTIKASAAAANSAEPISANVPEGSNSSRSRRIRR
ncbi:hypothetical protein ACJJTC_018287 [Scirpophaga incertulas]